MKQQGEHVHSRWIYKRRCSQSCELLATIEHECTYMCIHVMRSAGAIIVDWSMFMLQYLPPPRLRFEINVDSVWFQYKQAFVSLKWTHPLPCMLPQM